jgi:hypothetical protein
MRGFSFLMSFVLLMCLTSTLQATTIYIPGDYPTIQGGINGAFDGDTVMIAPGTYYEHEIDFMGKAIVVTGTDPEDSSVVAATTGGACIATAPPRQSPAAYSVKTQLTRSAEECTIETAPQ